MSTGFVKDEVIRVGAMIALARQMIAAGARVDLAPIGFGIDTLCRAVDRLPASEADSLKDELVKLNGRLEKLGDELTARYEAAMRPGPSLATPYDRT